ncbi:MULTISPECIES: FAD-dependent oxidoreductase [unclassified Saccharothrix]|uniref:FAD-dependent oxidoreductase n=1 Tax=unclassified Saccharothrix TaxID=2593673 RepID=UPI00307F64AE
MVETAERTTVAVVGGGPAGMVLGLLLARAGVEVTVLEKHGDFLRDFRGDTVHASTLTLLDELGLGPSFAEVPHQLVEKIQVVTDGGTATMADLSRLPGAHKHIALVPQWDFLDLLADAGKREAAFTLVMNAEVLGLVKSGVGVGVGAGSRVAGVRYRGADGVERTLGADLVVAADGRGSTVRREAGLAVRKFGVPMDVWWFRIPRHPGEPANGLGRFSRGSGLAMIPRGDYYQCAFLIRKGSNEQLRAEGIESFRKRVVDLAPWIGDRMETVESLDDVKLLDVKLDRLRRWHGDGVLCIGDAAHAMSPIGGVGINLAVQDAVAAARVLAGPARRGALTPEVLARVQRRRWFPTAVTQAFQRRVQDSFLRRTLEGRSGGVAGSGGTSGRMPRMVALMQRFPVLQAVPAYVVAIGLLPEHAPRFARRAPERISRD